MRTLTLLTPTGALTVRFVALPGMRYQVWYNSTTQQTTLCEQHIDTTQPWYVIGSALFDSYREYHLPY